MTNSSVISQKKLSLGVVKKIWHPIVFSLFYKGTCTCIMVARVVEFSSGDTKLERLLPKSQHTQRKFMNVKNWWNLI